MHYFAFSSIKTHSPSLRPAAHVVQSFLKIGLVIVVLYHFPALSVVSKLNNVCCSNYAYVNVVDIHSEQTWAKNCTLWHSGTDFSFFRQFSTYSYLLCSFSKPGPLGKNDKQRISRVGEWGQNSQGRTTEKRTFLTAEKEHLRLPKKDIYDYRAGHDSQNRKLA